MHLKIELLRILIFKIPDYSVFNNNQRRFSNMNLEFSNYEAEIHTVLKSTFILSIKYEINYSN